VRPVTSLLNSLFEVLEYAPRGSVSYFSMDPRSLAFAQSVVSIFKTAGWREGGAIAGATAADEKADAGSALYMLFVLKDRNQVSIARQAIEEFFERCGFVQRADGDKVWYISRERWNVLVMIVAVP
jgi:hypothetical protein